MLVVECTSTSAQVPLLDLLAFKFNVSCIVSTYMYKHHDLYVLYGGN